MRQSNLQSPRRASSGYTLVELMVALVLGLLVALAATSFYLLSRNSYSTIVDSGSLGERGNFALSALTRQIRQTAFAPNSNQQGGFGQQGTPRPNGVTPSLRSKYILSGLEGCSSPQVQEGELSCAGSTAAINNSDVLMLRFSGAESDETKFLTNALFDCSGQRVEVVTDVDNALSQMGTSIFYIGNGANGKPALMCMTHERDSEGLSTGNYVSNELVTGVEMMKVLFGISYANGYNNFDFPTGFLPIDLAQGIIDSGGRVVSIKVALVVRADNASADAGEPQEIQLFGPLYPASQAGATYTPSVDRTSARRLFSTTVQIRNVLPCAKDFVC